MADVANKDEMKRCLEIARQALATGDVARAGRMAAKAMRLFPCDEVGRRPQPPGCPLCQAAATP